MITFNARRRHTVSAAQGRYSTTKADLVRSYVLSKGDDNISFLTSSTCVFYSRAMITLYALHCATLCMLPKGDEGLPRLPYFEHVYVFQLR